MTSTSTWYLLCPLSCNGIFQMGGIPGTLTQKTFFLCSLLESRSLAEKHLMRGRALPPLSPNTAIGPITQFHSHIYHPPTSRLHNLLFQPDPAFPTLEWIDPLRYPGFPTLLTMLSTKAPPQVIISSIN